MTTHVQEFRSVQIKTPLEDNQLLFSAIKAEEQLSELFRYTVELLSTTDDVDFNELLGEPMTIAMALPNGGHRFLNGVVSHFSHQGYRDEYAVVEVVLRPWLWFLTQSRDCQIYQDLTIPAIVMQKFESLGFSQFSYDLSADYTDWNFCTQYQESDFDFISRLLEKEGIYYYFTHEDGKHTMVLCDHIGAHFTAENYSEVPFYPASEKQVREEDHFNEWMINARVVTDTVVLDDYGFLDPKGARQGALKVSHTLTGTDQCMEPLHTDYDYSADYPYTEKGEKLKSYADRIVQSRTEAYQAQRERVVGEGVVHGIGAGNLFCLTGYNRDDQNREYLVVKIEFQFSLGSYNAGDKSKALPFSCTVECLPSTIPFRPIRKTKKPLMQGVQTATVVGKSGEEIWTDKHGRVKLFFHWDYRSAKNEKSSCWVRVSQSWAGSGYGALHLPRINNEVLVEFINGDPDQPIVTGRVYNGDNETPFKLPAKATQSGFKSRSSKGGNARNYNEIRMEDKKGSEELHFHAEKNMTETVENDHSVSIGNDRSETIKKDKTLTVEGKVKETISGEHKVVVTEGNAIFEVQKGTGSLFFKKETSICTDATLKMASVKAMEVSSLDEMKVKAKKALSVSSESSTVNITGDGEVNVSSGAANVVLKAGCSSITLAPDGTITIKGTTVKIESGEINAKASGDVTIDGSEVRIN